MPAWTLAVHCSAAASYDVYGRILCETVDATDSSSLVIK